MKQTCESRQWVGDRCSLPSTAEAHRRRRERLRSLGRCVLALLAALVVGTLAGCSQEPEIAEPPPPKVTVAHPEQRELVNYNEYNGWTEASATVEVRARVRGHIHKVDFTDGQIVEKEALLFELDPRPFQSDIDRATEQVKIAEAQQDVSMKDEARQRMLLARDAATQSDVDKAEAVRKSWDAQVVAGKEEVKRRELELTYARITAPIGGRISRALLTEGNLVNAGGSDPILTTIVALDPIYVYFYVDERALLEYRSRRRSKGETSAPKNLESYQIPFQFGLETEAGYRHEGMLDFADNRIDPETGTIQVRGKIDNPEGIFAAGSRVRIRVPVSDPYPAVLVPETAILSDQNKKYLLCLNEQQVVVRRDVKLGKLLDDGMRAILSSEGKDGSLGPQDVVIVLGLQRARVNYPVEPLDAEGKPFQRGTEVASTVKDE